MNSSLFPFSPSVSVFVFLLLVFIEIPSSLSNADLYTLCKAQFVCGNITASFPFWGNDRSSACGRSELQLRCENNNITKIKINDVAYQVLDIMQDSESLRIAREDYLVGLCPPQLVSSTFDPSVFELIPDYANITIFYGCPAASITGSALFNCGISGAISQGGYVLPEGATVPGGCYSSVVVPVPFAALETIMILPALLETLKHGFEVKWNVDCGEECLRSQGACGFDNTSKQTTCYCPNQSKGSKTCVLPGGSPPTIAPVTPAGVFKTRWRLITAIAIPALVAAIVAVVYTIVRNGKRISGGKRISFWWESSTKCNQNIEEFMVSCQYLTPKRYSYSDVKKMTNSFNTKLGQGGFGCVYRGKLLDGRLVAVKVLTKFKTEGEEFINEVASISRTSHVNIVTLLGFCLERRKKALIYEYMPNGSLDKFISYEGCPHRNRLLEWKTLYEIAIGSARGLEYLHRGCNTRIVHFDIKPHNILLDEDFCPKISDFGLAKLCKTAESKVSVTGTRGTAGYIAPEVFCRNFGGVSYKSDVYSYGMMILEMVGERKKTDGGLSETSETYFPDWFYKHLEPGEISRLHEYITKGDEEIARKMILVGLWCIQMNPSDRPSMTKVVEMLVGSLQFMQIPPKPSFPSPKRSLQELFSAISSLPNAWSQKDEEEKLSVDEGDM